MSNLVTRATKGSALTHNQLDTNFKKAAQTKSGAYTIVEGDNRDTIEYSGAGGHSFTMPDAATIVAAADTGDFEVTFKHVGSGTLTVTCTTGADTIDGSTDDIDILPFETRTLKVNQAGNGYNIIGTGPIITLGTSVATTSGTTASFTGIPARAKEIVIGFNGVQTTTGTMFMQIGDSGGLENTGYLGGSATHTDTNASTMTTAFRIINTAGASSISGLGVMSLIDDTNNTWALSGTLYYNSLRVYSFSGVKSLSGVLTQLTVTSDTYTAGLINIAWK